MAPRKKQSQANTNATTENFTDAATPNDKLRNRHSRAIHGYIVEWRLKPESAALDTALTFGDVRSYWGQANYSINTLVKTAPTVDGVKVISPNIRDSDEELAAAGLVTYDVALALLTCLKTNVDEKFKRHIEWRLVRCEGTFEYVTYEKDYLAVGHTIHELPKDE